MKTRTNTTTGNGTRQQKRIPRKGTRKNIENRDLNVDNDTTNAPKEEEGTEKKVNDVTLAADRSVEDEEDREAKRKIADANPPEDIQN